ncbi:MAG: ribonuclease, partial [Anaerolineales bacterium]
PYLDAQSNGLTYLIDRMKGQAIYAHITLEKGERSLLADLASNLL